MTTETIVPTKTHPELHAAAEKLLEAAMAYWKVYARTLGTAAVVWVKDTDGRMLIFTRGEYRHTLMENVDRLQRDIENVRPYEE